MKTLSIQKTIYPDGVVRIWQGNIMPVHKYRELHTNQFNNWCQHIHDQSLKLKMWNKIINRIKAGGVAHIDGQESALRLAKEILS
jgi:hypothetical protein